MNYHRKQEKTIKRDYIAILPTLDLVYKLFKYDTDVNNAFLESSDNVLSESTKKTSSIWRKFKSNNSELRPLGYTFEALLPVKKRLKSENTTYVVKIPGQGMFGFINKYIKNKKLKTQHSSVNITSTRFV